MAVTARCEVTLAGRCGEVVAPAVSEVLDGAEVSFERTPQRVGEQDLQWPSRIRHIGCARVRLWGVEELLDDVGVIISELVTNALLYGDGQVIGFRISLHATEVRIEVSDGSPDVPFVRDAGPEDGGGRGMPLVSKLADRWGTSDGGTHTWCTVAFSGHREEAV